jgi:hypothetical protein
MHKEAVHSFIRKDSKDEKPSDRRPKLSWQGSLGALSGATLLAFLTRLLCPACWPVYAGVLSSMGLGFLIQKVWLMPLTIITLMFVIWSLAYRAKERRGYSPFILGLLGAVALLGGQFVFPSFAAGPALPMWVAISKWSIDAGAVLLVAASIWNGWPHKRKGIGADECPSCSSETAGA